MKKIILVMTRVIVLLFVVVMCINCRARETRNVSLEDDVTVVNDTVLPDSVVRLLMVAMPDSVAQQLLVRKAYVTSYNRDSRLPNWVAWHLTAEHMDGPWERLNQYHEDMDAEGPRAVPDDYRGCGRLGLSRGHMCPAADCKWDERAIYEADALTNICPQNRSMNSGLWNSIEIDCRKWARRFGDVYIVCGPLFLNREHETIGDNGVMVPEAFFKVVLCLSGTPKGMGFIARNNDGTRKRDLYYNSIDEVERIMGMDFFAALPDDIENVVEAEADMEAWR